MESFADFPYGEWDSSNKFVFIEELDFQQQILHQFSLEPSSFFANPEANTTIDVFDESSLFSSSIIGSNYPETCQTSNFNGSDQIAASNYINMSMDISPEFQNNVVEDSVNVIEDLLELNAQGDKINGSSYKNTKKRPRVSKNAPKVCKNVQKLKKSRKIDLDGDEGERNNGSGRSSSSTSCNSEDYNVPQDINGVATSNPKTSQALNLYAKKRRARINERLRVLQNLVPNGTKVDISTMLEETVHYVKFLQSQIKLLISDDLWMYAPIAYNGIDVGLNRKISTLLYDHGNKINRIWTLHKVQQE